MLTIGPLNFIVILFFLLLILVLVVVRPYYQTSKQKNHHNHFITPNVVNSVVKDAQASTYQTKTQTQLILFYRSDCYYSQLALPIWYQLLDEIVDGSVIDIIEQNCILDTTLCQQYNITKFPTIVLIKDGAIHQFNQEISLDNLNNFLQSNGVYLRKAITDTVVMESFATGNDYASDDIPDPTDQTNPKIGMKSTCPIISFDHFDDDTDKTSHYQIFSDQGQYGYSIGGDKEALTPFQAAYNTVDTYLSSLPDASPDNMNTCAGLYSDDLRQFGLCDSTQLNNMKTEAKNIINGRAKLAKGLKKKDYANKLNVITAIEKACSF